MSQRKATTPIPEPLEKYASQFDDLFSRVSQREGFRQYVAGLLMSAERNKTLTALANAEPIVGAQEGRVQSLQWYVSESCWEAARINQRRLALLFATPQLCPDPQGVLVIDETGDRKDGHHTAHVGRQYLANLGKIDNGVVSVSSLWADEQVYYPIEVEPYTPAAWFEGGKANPAFRTKLRIGVELVARALALKVPFRAVVADCFYGEDRGFREGLEALGVGYVLALKPSHSWWHHVSEIGSLEEYAHAQVWHSAQQPGNWVALTRTFRDGHQEQWWALEVRVGNAYGPEQAHRALVVTTDPIHLPVLNTWYLITNLPAPQSARAANTALAAADLAELVRLYALRPWVEQSYKQVKHALGWAHYQVRSDVAIRRHWLLVWCAFTFCWWLAAPQLRRMSWPPDPVVPSLPSLTLSKKTAPPTVADLASAFASYPGLAGAIHSAQTLLERLLTAAPALRPPPSAQPASPGPVY
jgi:SRSO17 transposase